MAMFGKSVNADSSQSQELMMDKFKKQRETPNKDKHFNLQKRIVIAGENSTGKTSLSLGLLMKDIQEDEVICIIDVDGSSLEIARTFYEEEFNNNQIVFYQPEMFKTTRNGATVVDEEATVLAITTIASEIKQAMNEGVKVRGVIIDGVSNILRYCESKMRQDEGLSASSGTSLNVWKIRNSFFRSCTNAFKQLNTNVVYICHEDFIANQEKPLAEVKMTLLNEASIKLELSKIVSDKNENIIYHIAKIKKNRADIFSVGDEVKFLTVNYEAKIVEDDYEALYNLLLQKSQNNK